MTAGLANFRKRYLDAEDVEMTHAAYYRSIAEMAGVNMDAWEHLPNVALALYTSDPQLNTIPMRYWDNLGGAPFLYEDFRRAFKAHGDLVTQAGLVCMFKQAAKESVYRLQQGRD